MSKPKSKSVKVVKKKPAVKKSKSVKVVKKKPVVKKSKSVKGKKKPVKKKVYSSSSDSDDDLQENVPIIDSKLSIETYKLFNDYVDNIKISKEIESGLRKYIKCICSDSKFMYSAYVSKRQDLLTNMNPKSRIENTKFISRLLSKKLYYNDIYIVTWEAIPFLKPYELFPEKWEIEISKKELREAKSQNIKTSDAHKCRKCGSKKSIVNPPLQIRSADEPMTTYITCAVCSSVIRV